MSTRETTTMPPAAARWLGGFGLLPFIGASATACLAGDVLSMQAFTALIAYGSVILSFIGGAHWGLAGPHLNGPLAKPARTILALSVVPSLVGWTALLLPTPWSLSVLATAFMGVLALDRHTAAIGLAPMWWMRLRVPLSVIAAFLMVAALLMLLMLGDGSGHV